MITKGGGTASPRGQARRRNRLCHLWTGQGRRHREALQPAILGDSKHRGPRLRNVSSNPARYPCDYRLNRSGIVTSSSQSDRSKWFPIMLGRDLAVAIWMMSDWPGWATDTVFSNNIFYTDRVGRYGHAVVGFIREPVGPQKTWARTFP